MAVNIYKFLCEDAKVSNPRVADYTIEYNYSNPFEVYSDSLSYPDSANKEHNYEETAYYKTGKKSEVFFASHYTSGGSEMYPVIKANTYHEDINSRIEEFAGERVDVYEQAKTFIKIHDKLIIANGDAKKYLEPVMLYEYALNEINKMSKEEAKQSNIYKMKKDIENYFEGKREAPIKALDYISKETYDEIYNKALNEVNKARENNKKKDASAEKQRIKNQIKDLIEMNVIPKEGLFRKYPTDIEKLQELLPKVSQKYHDLKEKQKEQLAQKETNKQEHKDIYENNLQ